MTKFKMKIEKEVTAKIIALSAKVRDSGTYDLIADDGTILKTHDGYVPAFFPGENYGDYLDLKIDLETGTIINWKAPTAAQLQDFVDKSDD